MKQTNGGTVVLVVVVLVLVVAPLLYVASIGPAAGLASRGVIRGDEDSIAIKFYWPLLCVQARCEPIGQGLVWYTSLWQLPVPAQPVPAQHVPSGAYTPAYSAPASGS